MRKTLLLVPILAATLAVSACAKHDDAANTAFVNETVLNDADANGATVDGFGNDGALAGNDAAPLDAADNAGNAL